VDPIPKIPSWERPPGAALLRFHDEKNSVVVCRPDGSGRVSFPFTQFATTVDGSRIAILDWSTRPNPGADEDDLVTRVGIQDAGTGELVPLALPDAEIVDLAWAPDGACLWFSTGGRSSRRLSRYLLATGKCEAIADGVGVRPSPDGRWLAFFGLRPAGVHVLDLGSMRSRFVAEGHAHAWSPDSRRLAFLSTDGRGWQLFVLEAASGLVSPIPSPFSYWPTWMPDSENVVFVVHEKGSAVPPSRICTARVGSTKWQSITDGPWDDRPRVHPRLGLLAYQTRSVTSPKDTRVVVMDLRTGGATDLGPGSEPEWLPAAVEG
jgi:Tol biopolymer transport system component